MQIEKGNNTWQAIKALGWDHCAVVFVDDDETTARAFAIDDNYTSDVSEFDVDLLAAQVLDMTGDGFDIDDLVMPAFELDDLLPTSEAPDFVSELDAVTSDSSEGWKDTRPTVSPGDSDVPGLDSSAALDPVPGLSDDRTANVASSSSMPSETPAASPVVRTVKFRLGSITAEVPGYEYDELWDEMDAENDLPGATAEILRLLGLTQAD